MVHTQYLHARLNHLGERLVEPGEIFLLDVAIAHLHEGAAVHSYHHQLAHGEHKAVIAPQVIERFASTLAPVVLVVSRNHIEWMSDAVENRLHVAQLHVATLVGEVARHEHRIHIGVVDFLHS